MFSSLIAASLNSYLWTLVVRFKELQFCTDIDKLSKLFPGAGCSAAPASECMWTALLTVAAGTPVSKREGSLDGVGGN